MIKFVSIVYTAITLLLTCIGAWAQDNPFMRMADKKYADYSQELYDIYMNFSRLDTLEEVNVIRQLEEVARKTGRPEWQLQVEIFRLTQSGKRQKEYGDDFYPIEKIIEQTYILLDKAQKTGNLPMEFKLRSDIIYYCQQWVYDYEQAFELCAIQERRLQTVSSADIPEKTRYYLQIADGYFAFKDYTHAIRYFNKVLDGNTNRRNEHSRQSARNGLGLCYLRGFNDLDRADSCFLAIIEAAESLTENEFPRYLWVGIAEGNLGHTGLLRGDDDSAAMLFESSLEKMQRYGDYAFASGDALSLATICLKKGNLSEAKRYLDMAIAYNLKMPRDGRMITINEVASKYYAATGNQALSVACMDSMLAAIKADNEQFNAMFLLRMEQKELAIRQQELLYEKERHLQTQIRLLALSAGFAVIVVLLGLLFFFYRRNRAAYRELVRKSLVWANTKVEASQPVNVEDKTAVTQADRQLFDRFQTLFQQEKMFRDAEISAEVIARKMNINKNYLSRAINVCTGDNINSYINEWRIKEAIRLMSDTASRRLSIEEIALKSGFYERKTFYNAFKKMTGLSPSDFRKHHRERLPQAATEK